MKRLILVVLLAGCATPYEVASSRCQQYGFTQGTDNFAGCMQREIQQRQALNQQQYNQDIARQAEQRRRQDELNAKITLPQRPVTNCTPDGFGGFRCQ